MKDLSKKTNLLWYNLALMAYTTVWGFGNVVNNYSTQGLQVVFSWILIMLVYFIPYVLIVGELGSTFNQSSGGVSSWVKETKNIKWAYMAAWTYWVVHIPYLAQKPQTGLTAFGWLVTASPDFTQNFTPLVFQTVTLVLFLLFVFIASRGIKPLKVLGTIAGLGMFVMSLLYILLGVSAILFLNIDFATQDITFHTFIPTLNLTYLTTFSLLVFAVGGSEKISPYVNQVDKPAKNFPKAMIALAIMVGVSAILGSIAMGAMIDSNNIPEDLIINGQYYAFQQLGSYYGVGNLFMRIYALANTISQFTVLLISIDAPLRILLSDANPLYIPKGLTKTNKYGVPINGYYMAAILTSILIMLPVFGSSNVAAMVEWMTKLNSIVMPLRYLWVFLAYYLVKKHSSRYTSEYKFVKNDKLGMAIASWCFLFTALACILGMIPDASLPSSQYNFQLATNIITPIVLIGLGFILPIIANQSNKKNNATL